MAKSKSKRIKHGKPEEVETEPGAVERFERTVRRMLNTIKRLTYRRTNGAL